MFSKDSEIEQCCIKIDAALHKLFESTSVDKKNPYEGMCYVASVVLKRLVGRKVILWKVRDHNNQFHWWCETPDGEIIDLTSKQYSLNSLPVPSLGRASRLKEQGRQMTFKSYQKRIKELLDIVENIS
tara:strand:- start:612 stop:995 length:384 start_codon:yes stop_codon:yes gene_type:complete